MRKFLLHLCVSVSPTFLRCSHMWRPSTNGIYSYLLYKPDHHKRFMDVLIIEGNKLKLVIVQFNIFEMCCRICCRVILCSSSSSSLLLVVLSICCLSCLFVVLSRLFASSLFCLLSLVSCCLGCLLSWMFVILNVCCLRCLLYWMFVVLDVCCLGC